MVLGWTPCIVAIGFCVRNVVTGFCVTNVVPVYRGNRVTWKPRSVSLRVYPRPCLSLPPGTLSLLDVHISLTDKQGRSETFPRDTKPKINDGKRRMRKGDHQTGYLWR